jgi:hypothetical protein
MVKYGFSIFEVCRSTSVAKNKQQYGQEESNIYIIK